MIHWQRPPGPLNVWKIVEGYEESEDGTKKIVKFSIQDVPDESKRRQEVHELMIDYFLPDEPTSKCTSTIDLYTIKYFCQMNVISIFMFKILRFESLSIKSL